MFWLATARCTWSVKGMLWQAWSLNPDARQLGPRRSGRLVHPGRYAGCWPRWPLSLYGGRSRPVSVARGGSGCVSLALPSALFRELLLSYGGGLGEPTTVYVLHTMAAQSWAPLGWAAGPNVGFPSTKAAGPYCGRPAGRGAVWEGGLPPTAPIWALLEHGLARADEPLPTEQPPLMDLDLQFAVAGNYGSLRDLRQGAVRALRELKSRWARVSTRLRRLQPDAIRVATQQRDLGLLGLLVVLLSWGDVAMPLGFVRGLPAVGLAPPYGIFPQQPALPSTLKNVFFDCEAHNSEIRASLKPGLRDEFLLSQSVADAEAGFCTPPLTWSQLLRETQGKPIRLIPRCVIQQSSGKQRIIDNAHTGGQSAFSSESNKLVLCSALRPAQHASLAVSALGFDRAKEVLQHDSLEGGGEDWPNAYRSCPMSADESRASSVGIIVNGGFLRTSCTQGSSLACPWLSRLSTGIPDSVKPWDADSCSSLYPSILTTRISLTGPRAKGPGSRPFGT